MIETQNGVVFMHCYEFPVKPVLRETSIIAYIVYKHCYIPVTFKTLRFSRGLELL